MDIGNSPLILCISEWLSVDNTLISNPFTLSLSRAIHSRACYQNPVHSRLTKTSPSLGSGTGTSCRISSLPCGPGLSMHAAVWYSGIAITIAVLYFFVHAQNRVERNSWGSNSLFIYICRGVFPIEFRQSVGAGEPDWYRCSIVKRVQVFGPASAIQLRRHGFMLPSLSMPFYLQTLLPLTVYRLLERQTQEVRDVYSGRVVGI